MTKLTAPAVGTQDFQLQTKTLQNKLNQNQIRNEQEVQLSLRMPIIWPSRNYTEVIHQQQ